MPSLRRLCILIIGASLIASAAWAQINRGSITGIVTDPSGAIIPSVAITVTNQATGIANNLTTNEAGVYAVPLLPAGVYTVNAEKTGFKKFVEKNVVVNVGNPTRLDFSLTIGQTTQTVTVTGTALTLDRESSDTSATVTEQEVEELPLTSTGDQRTPADFMQLAPGVTGHGPSLNINTTGENMTRTMSTMVSGSMVGSTSISVDGADVVTPDYWEGMLGALQIPPDAVDEFKLEATNAPAEYGRTAGGAASFNVKSGTNQIHGDAYEYNRNTAVAAVPFFENSAAPGCLSNGVTSAPPGEGVKACNPTYKQNEFGVTAGGPIKKDKAFVFGWYDGFRLIQSAFAGAFPTPTDAMKQGNFQQYTQSGVPGSGSPVIPIYDPTTKTLCGPEVCNNIINTADFDRVSKLVLPLFPEPNGNNTSGTNNYSSSAANPYSLNMWGIKGDYVINEKNRLSGVYFQGSGSTPNIPLIPPPLEGGDQTSVNLTRNVRGNLNTIISPTMTNQFTVSWNLYNQGAQPVSTWAGKSNWSSYLGLMGFAPNYPTEFPQIVIDGFSYNGGGGAGFQNEHSTNIIDSLTLIKGKHTLKFGGQFLNAAINEIYVGRTAGWFNFLPQETGLPGNSETGAGFASFLLGLVDEAQAYHENVPNYPRDSYWGVYGQDDWKISKKLTANLGLRWDVFYPATQRYNTKSWIDTALPNPGAPGETGTLQFAIPANPSGENLYLHNIAPRIGLAYALNDKTVIRAAYGIYYAQGNGDRLNTPGDFVQGWNGTADLASTNGGITPGFVWGTQTMTPFASNLTPTAYNGGGSQYASAGVLFAIDRTDSMAPYNQNYQFMIERQLPGQMKLTVAYVGNEGTHLASRGLVPMDKMPPQYLTSLGPLLGSDGATPLLFAPISDPVAQANVPTSFVVDPTTGDKVPFVGFQLTFNPSGVPSKDPSLGQALRTEPQFNGWHRIGEAVGTSNYDALQVKLEKRFSKGLTLLVSYAWSKTLTNGGAMFSTFSSEFGSTTPWNAHDQKAYSFEDIPNNLSIAFVYNLPFGQGKAFLNQKGVVNQIIGGWKVSGILQYESGRPQNIEVSGHTNGLEDQGWGSPNQINGVPMASSYYHLPKKGPGPHFDPNVDSQFNNAAFSLPCTFCFGTLTPTEATVRDFWWPEEDLSVLKDWTIHEGWVLNFHADAINAFNRAVFGSDNGSYASEPTFGQPGFGLANGQVNYPRVIQFGMRLKW